MSKDRRMRETGVMRQSLASGRQGHKPECDESTEREQHRTGHDRQDQYGNPIHRDFCQSGGGRTGVIKKKAVRFQTLTAFFLSDRPARVLLLLNREFGRHAMKEMRSPAHRIGNKTDQSIGPRLKLTAKKDSPAFFDSGNAAH